MAAFIEVGIREPDYTQTGRQRRFIVAVSDAEIDSDLQYGTASVACECFGGAAAEVRKFINENRPVAEEIIAGRVAERQYLDSAGPAAHIGIARRKAFAPATVAPPRSADGQIGGFPVWEV